MAWIESLTSPNTILRDLATQFCTANTNPDGSLSSDNWKLVYPRPFQVVQATNEALTATDGTNKIYQAAAGHQNWYPWTAVQVFVGGTATAPNTYTADYTTGKITFSTAQTMAVTATFQYESASDQAAALKTVNDRVVLKTTINAQNGGAGSVFNTDPSQSVMAIDMFVEMVRPLYLENPEAAISANATNVRNFHYIKIRMFDEWNDVAQDVYPRTIDAMNGSPVYFGSHVSDWSKFAWYQDWAEVLKAQVNGSMNVDDITQGVVFTTTSTKGLYGDSPIQYYLSVNSQRAALVLMGDPTIDYDNYLISFGYMGRINSYTYTTKDAVTGQDVINYYSNDTQGNFALSVSSSTIPAMSIDGEPAVTRDAIMNNVLDSTFTESWGTNTANGVTDIAMFRTRSGVYYQKHQISFITPEEYTQKDAFNPSRYTGKFHLSPAYIIHGYDGYRGFLDSVVVVDNSSIVHLDELIVNQGQPNEEVYKYFKLNAPYSVFMNSGNWHYGVAIKKV